MQILLLALSGVLKYKNSYYLHTGHCMNYSLNCVKRIALGTNSAKILCCTTSENTTYELGIVQESHAVVKPASHPARVLLKYCVELHVESHKLAMDI